jgi:hypothetical protein
MAVVALVAEAFISSFSYDSLSLSFSVSSSLNMNQPRAQVSSHSREIQFQIGAIYKAVAGAVHPTAVSLSATTAAVTLMISA